MDARYRSDLAARAAHPSNYGRPPGSALELLTAEMLAEAERIVSSGSHPEATRPARTRFEVLADMLQRGLAAIALGYGFIGFDEWQTATARD